MQQQLYDEINEFYFFHATKPDVVSVMVKQGFDPRLAKLKGRLGFGVYGAEVAAKSHIYAGQS